MAQPVMHFEVIGKDGPALHRFYSELFDWEIKADNPMGYGIVEPSGDSGIGGGIMGTDQAEAHVTFYVAVPDLQASLDKAEELGGSTALPPTHVMEGVDIAQFKDPEGHMIGLVKSESGQ